jgi:hypothetical protein
MSKSTTFYICVNTLSNNSRLVLDILQRYAYDFYHVCQEKKMVLSLRLYEKGDQ